MGRVLLTLAISTFSLALYAQKGDTTSSNDLIFTTPVEVMPEFKGGIDRFYARLQNISYRFLDRMNQREGKTFALLLIEKNGIVSNIKIIHGISPEEDNEMIKIIKRLQKWKPGMQDGKPVRVQYAVPINFELAKE